MKPFSEIVDEAIGEASMCWSEEPKGIFNSTKAKEIADRILASVVNVPKTRDVIYTLRNSAEKIKFLRKENQLITARLSGFEDAMELLRARKETYNQGVEECSASRAEKLAEELERTL